MATAHAASLGRDTSASESAPATAAPPAPLGVVRILLGFVFLWSFLDKAFGLYGTSSEESWLAGSSPTSGYLSGVGGPFADVFQALAGQAWVDWAFMLGMGLVGTALVAGVGLRLAAVGAVCLMGSLYLTSLPLEDNPIVDEHLLYAALAVAVASLRAGHVLGAGRWWATMPAVQRSRWLQ